MARRSRSEDQDINRLRRRLQRASFRLEMAQLERTWAVLSAASQQMSVREIADAVGLSPTRVHQILTASVDHPVEVIQSILRELGWPTPGDGTVDPESVADRLSNEATILGQCAEWLEQLQDNDTVVGPVINLRPDDHWPHTNHAVVDRARVVRILHRIAADIEELARARTISDTGFAAKETNPVERLRRQLGEPEIPRPSGPLSVPQGRRAWHRYEQAMQLAGLTPPLNPYRHLGTYIDKDPWPHRSAN